MSKKLQKVKKLRRRRRRRRKKSKSKENFLEILNLVENKSFIHPDFSKIRID
jgi:hypothetical protein